MEDHTKEEMMAKRRKFREWYADRDADARMLTGLSIRELARRGYRLWGKAVADKAMARQVPEPDPLQEAYDILGLSPNCSGKMLRKMYQFRVQEVHPDTGGSDEAFKRVDGAMDRICDARGIKK